MNVTPDSFSDGGFTCATESAVAHAIRLLDEGASIIDIGGESTRPGAPPVSKTEELDRVVPVIEKLMAKRPAVKISIDTSKPAVALAAMKAGAFMINDVTGFRDENMIEVARETSAVGVIMHMKGSPSTMQESPVYDNLIGEIKAFFEDRIKACIAGGVKNLLLDPGIGFGKTVSDNLEIIRNIESFTDLGYRVMIGASRKSFLGAITGRDVGEREEATMAVTAISVLNGATVLRVHNVKENLIALKVAHAVKRGE